MLVDNKMDVILLNLLYVWVQS